MISQKSRGADAPPEMYRLPYTMEHVVREGRHVCNQDPTRIVRQQGAGVTKGLRRPSVSGDCPARGGPGRRVLRVGVGL